MDHNYTMTSAQKQKAISLWRVLSDAFRIISSNPLHFLALSLIFFIFLPIIIVPDVTLTEQPTPTSFQYHESFLSNKTPPSTFNTSTSTYYRSNTWTTEQPQILFLFLYVIPLLFTEKPLLVLTIHLIRLCSVASITHSIFNGIHNKPLKLSSSLKSITSSFFPLLATNITQALIVAATFVVLVFGLLSTAIVIFGLGIIGVASNVIVVCVVILICDGLVRLVLVDVVAVAESKYGVAPFKRSSSLVEGKRVVALLILLLFQVLPSILSVLFMILEANITGTGGGGGGGGAGLMLLNVLLYVVVHPLSSLFYLAANTVFYVHCKNQLGQGAHVENQ